MMRALSLWRSYLGQCPDPGGEFPNADLLLQRGLAQFSHQQGSVCTLVESNLWSYMVRGLQTSLNWAVSLAEVLVYWPNGLAFAIPQPTCVHHPASGLLNPQTMASSSTSFLSVVKMFWPLTGGVHWHTGQPEDKELKSQKKWMKYLLISCRKDCGNSRNQM